MSFIMSPKALRDAFLDAGFFVLEETPYNWILAKGENDVPFVLPRKGTRVGAEIMQRAMDHAPSSTLHTSIYNKAHAKGDAPKQEQEEKRG